MPDTSKGQPLETKEETVDLLPGQDAFIPPLTASLVGLMRLRGRAISPGRLVANLPGGFTPPSPEDCLRSASLGGLDASLVTMPDIAAVPDAVLPCILVLEPEPGTAPSSAGLDAESGFPLDAEKANPADGEASPAGMASCILLTLDRGNSRAEVIFPAEDPASRSIPLSDLAGRYAGKAVFLPQQGPKMDARTESLHLTPQRHWFWGVLRDFSPLYRDVALASFVVNLLTLASPLFIMNVYDRVVPNNAVYTLWVLVIGLMIAHLMDFILRNVRGRFVDTAGRNADVIISSMLMDRLLHMRLEAKPESTGGLVNNLREFEQIRDFFGSTTLLALFDLPFLVLFIFLVAFIGGGPMVLLVICALPMMLGFIWLLQRPFRHSLDRQFKQNIHKNSLLVEIISGLETVKSIMAQGHMKRLWEQVVDAAAAESANSRRLASLAQTGSLFITYLINAGVIIIGVYSITAGQMTQGGLIACVILVSRALGPFMQIAAILTQMQRSRIALNALELIVALPVERQGETGSDTKGLEPELMLSNVTFRYPKSATTSLKNVSFRIRPGEKVGVVGASGAGKSTLARLLVGLYHPEDGNVSFGGVDIRQLDQNDLRTRIGFMSQDNYLFYGTVRENIAMGCPWVDMKTLTRAAELAGVTDFVSKHPLGFDMPVGEQGRALSGGQQQAVALARTLIRSPEVLVLDEPSSNMDMAREYRLMLRLRSILGNRTLVVFTHRPSLLSLVDRVLVMDEGTLLAEGPRDAVLQAIKDGKIKVGGIHG